MSVLKWTTILAASGAALIGTGLYAFQTAIIYPSSVPSGSRTLVDTPDRYGMPEYEDITLATHDGEKLHCFLIMQTKDIVKERPTIIIFHANAGNMGHRLPIARVFYHQMKLNVLMMSYRGYGRSSGVANEKGMKIDSQTAVEFILDHEVLRHTKLFAFGQSIGGAVALDVVSRNQSRFAGLIIENTFLSIKSLIPSVMPLATPIARFCHQFWSSETLIHQIEVPVLFLSGLKDELVPKAQMAQLFSMCQSKRKVWKEFPNGTHNDTVAQPGYMNDVFDFITEVMTLAQNSGLKQ